MKSFFLFSLVAFVLAGCATSVTDQITLSLSVPEVTAGEHVEVTYKVENVTKETPVKDRLVSLSYREASHLDETLLFEAPLSTHVEKQFSYNAL